MTAYARHTDPTTSHQAAASVADDLTKVKKTIIALLQAPATDEQLLTMYNVIADHKLAPKQSPSGIRTRRNELYRAGLLEAVGYGKTTSNRTSIVWKAKND